MKLITVVAGLTCAFAPAAAMAQASDPEWTIEEANRSIQTVSETAGRDTVIMPIPVSSPAIGSGLGLAAMALYRPGGRAVPWTSGVGGMYTDSKSWGAAVFHKANFNEDRLRLNAAAGLGDLHVDFYGIGADAGSRDMSIALEQKVHFASGRILTRIRDGTYLGVTGRYLDVRTILDLSEIDLPGDLTIPPLERDSRTVTLGAALEHDTRDSPYGPRRGLYGTADYVWADEALGGDFNYTRLQASLNAYAPLAENTVVAARVSLCNVGDGAPFYDLCSFGQNADLRGYASGRFRDHALLAGQVELRQSLSRRFGVVVFAGVGGVAADLDKIGEGELLPAAGLGLRYRASEAYGVNLSIDYAVGRDSHGLYFRIGEAF